MHIGNIEVSGPRHPDPFRVAPIEIDLAVRSAGEIALDSARAASTAPSDAKHGAARISVSSPSPRLRQLLAILGWVPEDPATDEVWFIEEPITLPATSSRVVAGAVARSCADLLNSIFGSDDGSFSGGAVDLNSQASTSSAMRSELKMMGAREYVARSIASPDVPPTVLHYWLERHIARTNAARARAGIPRLVCPARTTVGRWLTDYQGAYRERPGMEREWRDHLHRMPVRPHAISQSRHKPAPGAG